MLLLGVCSREYDDVIGREASRVAKISGRSDPYSISAYQEVMDYL